MKNKDVFKVEIDGQMRELAVLLPSAKNKQDAQVVANRAMKEAVDNGAYLRPQLEVVIRSRGLWNDEMQREHDALEKKVLEGERKLAAGNMKLSEGRALALEIARARSSLASLRSSKLSLDEMTAEAQAENQRFNYYVAVCTVYNDTGERVFKGLDDFLEKSNDVVAQVATNKLFALVFGVDDDHEKNRPENKFLLEYGFVNDDLRLINKDGHLIDEQGRLIDEFGFYVNEKGERVDINGYPVDETGQYIVDFKPFLDEEGSPLETVKVEATAETKKAKPKKEKVEK